MAQKVRWANRSLSATEKMASTAPRFRRSSAGVSSLRWRWLDCCRATEVEEELSSSSCGGAVVESGWRMRRGWSNTSTTTPSAFT